ncbi:MAG TPA: EAL domain-containing protein [Hyphomicrobiaceae bacterium]|nr:EAL domain-containing protein [Hyphomicrobiaceae bacterium]
MALLQNIKALGERAISLLQASFRDERQTLPLAGRLQIKLHEHDVYGERAIAIAQGAIACFVLALHLIAQTGDGVRFANPWVVLALVALATNSLLRLRLAKGPAARLPERALAVLNVLDAAIFLVLIWNYQFAYGHPAGGVLKAPSSSLLFALVAMRALRFDPRPVLTVGVTAVAGWALLTALAVAHDGPGAITRSYADYLASHRVLLGAEVERLTALTALIACLAVATHKARRLLSMAAHADDYAESLRAAQRHLEEANEARRKFEATVAELDRHKADLSEQIKRFDVALENMSQGLAMYDANQRLLVCNKKFAQLYRLPPELIQPGVTLRQIVAYRIANGIYAGASPEEYMSERTAPVVAASDTVHELSDGRAIAIARRPMAGGGWVTTHEDITERRRAEARIAHMARHDVLTDLPNRACLAERLEQAVACAKRGELVAIHVFDLDRFKCVNDTLGHLAGDKLLKCVGERLRAVVRETDSVARIGGDEFAIVQVALKGPADASVMAERVIETIGTPFDIDGHQASVGASVGIAIGPIDGDTSEQLMRNADLALYRAKSDGRGTYRFFEAAMDAQMRARRAMEADLRKGLTNGEFVLHYQPLVDLNTNEITGCEALIRWFHPERGLVSPAEFVPLAEENGFIVALGEWVIRQACLTAAGWPAPLKVSVNLSPAQFRNTQLASLIVSALGAAGLAPERLELEITESVLLANSEANLATLTQLRTLGVKIALDDFGSGYSSLAYLQKFPFDRIKIDRCFVRDIGASASARNIVRAMAAMANGLGMATTAEGVETEEQRAAVLSEGCSEMQGYLISRALPAPEIERLFLRRAGPANSPSAATGKPATAA